MVIQSKNEWHFFVFSFLCVKSEKLRNRVFPVTPLLSIVFVSGVFGAYLRWVSGVVEVRRLYPVDTVQAMAAKPM